MKGVFFEVGQMYRTKRNPKRFAVVINVRSDSQKAVVEMRDDNGRTVVEAALVSYRQFKENWERV